jgi:ABC-type glycerol-3-phosphate transport system permease component
MSQAASNYEEGSFAKTMQGAKGNFRISRFAFSLLFVVISALFFIPFYWMAVSSVRNPDRIFADAAIMYPNSFNLQGYVRLFTETKFVTWFGNSLIMTVGFALLSLAVCTMGGYALAHYRFKFRNAIFVAILGSQMVPFYLMLIPLFIMLIKMKSTGIGIDTYWGVILPLAAQPFGLFFMRQYMLGISKELLDAARVDGASEYRIFWSVVLPLCKPALGAVLILFSLDMWNNFLWPLIVMRTDNHFPLAVGLSTLVNVYKTEWDLVMTGSVLSTIPVLILFLFFQRQFISGLTTTGLLVEK